MFSNCILTVVLVLPFTLANCHCASWNKYDEIEYCLSSVEKTYFEAQDTCVKMGGYLALPKSENSENAFVKLLDGQQLNKPFYIGLSAELVWDDCTKPRKRHLQNVQVNNTKIKCAVGSFKGRNRSISWEFRDCVVNAGFVCERKSENSSSNKDCNVPLFGCPSSRRVPSASGTFQPYNASDAANDSMSPFGFSLDLISFLIGLSIPCPLLLAAVVKIIYSAKCFRRKKRKGANFSVTSTTARSYYNHGSRVSSALPETSHESAYVNMEGRVNQHPHIERPIGSLSQEYIQPAIYEDYDFSATDNYDY